MHGLSERRDEIVKWVTKHSGPPVETLRRMADYQKAKKQNVYVVAFFDEFEVASTADSERQAQSCDRDDSSAVAPRLMQDESAEKAISPGGGLALGPQMT